MRLVYFLFSALFLMASCSDDEPEFVDDKSSEQLKTPDKQENKQKDSVKADDRKNSFSNEKPVAVISPIEAGQYNGKVVTVRGFVADVYKSDRVAYLNFVEKYPKNPFSAVIFASRFSAFENIEDYRLKDIEVTGRISFYRGKPQIIVNGPEQIVVK